MKKLHLLALAVGIAILMTGCSSKDNKTADTDSSDIFSYSPVGDTDVYSYPSATEEPYEDMEGTPYGDAEGMTDNEPYIYPADEIPSESAEPTQESETTLVPAATDALPISAPVNATVNPYASLGYSSVTSVSLGVTLQYPTGWTNKPGRYTICYQQNTAAGIFPARISVTVKSLKHTPQDKDDIIDEFRSYFQSLADMYEKDDFTVGKELEETTFLEQNALASTYITMSGNTEVKGYCIITAIGRKLIVYHFCCAYDDYAMMEPIRTSVRDSVRYDVQ